MKKKLGIILSVLYVLILAASGIIGTVSAEPDVQLVVISPHWEGITNEFETTFKVYYQANYGEIVDIEWIDVGGTSDVIKYVDSQYESTPEGIGIDIWWGGGVDPFIEQAEKGTLVPYQVDESILSKIPSDLGGVPMYDEEYRWYGSALSGFGIVYNKALLELEGLPTPETWEDLTDPRCEGWVGSADPRHSGSTHMAYEIILQAYGWEEGMKISTLLGANVKTWPGSSSAVPKSVGAGDIAYGLAIDQYAWSEVAKVGADKIGYVMPEGLTVINPDSIAILKGAPNLEVAKRFVTFTLSDEAQKLWMLPVGAEGGPQEYLLTRLSVIPSLYGELAGVSIVPVNPFEVESTLDYNATLGSLRYSFVNDLIGSTMIDTHEELVAAWEDVIAIENALDEAGVTSLKIDQAKDKLGEVPITLEESLEAAGNWSDATLRNRYISEWHVFALGKYESASIIAALAEAELAQSGLESEKEEIEATYESEVEALEAQIEALEAQHENDLAAMQSQYEAVIDDVKAEKQSNLYMGLGGGAVVGLIVGFAASYFMARQKEVAAIQA
jgi:ABC-type Fe3+ transport system substrate-binding protein